MHHLFAFNADPGSLVRARKSSRRGANPLILPGFLRDRRSTFAPPTRTVNVRYISSIMSLLNGLIFQFFFSLLPFKPILKPAVRNNLGIHIDSVTKLLFCYVQFMTIVSCRRIEILYVYIYIYSCIILRSLKKIEERAQVLVRNGFV